MRLIRKRTAKTQADEARAEAQEKENWARELMVEAGEDRARAARYENDS